jgi:hypothetical protein
VRTVEPKQDWRLNALKACRVSAAASRQHTHDKRWQVGGPEMVWTPGRLGRLWWYRPVPISDRLYGPL